jgi:hypothetical protein
VTAFGYRDRRFARRGLICLIALAAVWVMTPAAQAAPSATATLSGSGTGYVLQVTNNGAEGINCLRFRAPDAVTITGVNGPGTLMLDGSHGFRSNDLALVPGQTATFSFTTSAQWAGGDATLAFSSTCVAGSDVTINVGAPPAAGTGTTGTDKCECLNLVLEKIVPLGFNFNGRVLGLRVKFTISCSNGAGGCEGKAPFKVIPGGKRPQDQIVKRTKVQKPRNKEIVCQGPCFANTEISSTVYLRFPVPIAKLAMQNIPVDLEFDRLCLFNGQFQKVHPAPRHFRILFNPVTKKIDKNNSDLTGQKLSPSH